MEDVLEVYHSPHDPKSPRVCMDEQPVQLVKEVRVAQPGKPGTPEVYDYEYERNGTANLFMFVEPWLGWRQVKVTPRRTATDWAHQVRELVDRHFPEAERVRLILDNLNQAFPPDEARRIARKLELHYTPKHGSWLNMAEIELSVLTGQCLARRIPDAPQLQFHIDAWQTERNFRRATTNWKFNLEQARFKLRRSYPQVQD